MKCSSSSSVRRHRHEDHEESATKGTKNTKSFFFEFMRFVNFVSFVAKPSSSLRGGLTAGLLGGRVGLLEGDLREGDGVVAERLRARRVAVHLQHERDDV